jgi:cytidylate kinase
MKLIGLSGTNGAGKDSVGELLAAKHGILFVSVTDMLRDECRKRGLPVEREHLRAISGEWRREGGLGVLIDKATEVFKAQTESYTGLVVSSLRNPGEADRVHELYGAELWIDASPEVRYQRITQRDAGRSEDQKTYEQFLSEQEAEMNGVPGDPTSLKMSAVKDKSDVFILNDGDDKPAFEAHVVFTLTEAGLL